MSENTTSSSSSSGNAVSESKAKARSAPKKKKKEEAVKPSPKEAPKQFVVFERGEEPDNSWLINRQKTLNVADLGVAEFIYVFNTLTTKDQRILMLRKAKGDPVLMTILNINFQPDVYSIYVPSEKELETCRPSTLPWGLTPFTIRNQIRRIKLLLKNNPGSTSDNVKSRMFCEFMESLHPSEAKILLHVGKGTLTELAPELTPKLVKSAFGESRFPNL